MNVQALLKENVDLHSKVLHQDNQIKVLQERLNWFERQFFGKRSERIIDNPEQLNLDLDLEAAKQEEKEKQTINAHNRRKAEKDKDKIHLPENLPVEIQVLDIPEKDKICPKTGKPLIKIGEESSEKIIHKPGSYYIKRIIRPKYALPDNQGILIQELPSSILPRSKADESLLAEIITKKFADHLPLYRIAEMLSREDIFISRKLLSQWVVRCGEALKPLYLELQKEIFKSKAIHVDESPVDMQKPGNGKVHQSYMWVVAAGGTDPPYCLYNFRENRKHENATQILQGYRGIVHSDKYGAYEYLANKKEFLWCPCWAHIRRKFFEAESGDLEFREFILEQIQKLFIMEKVAWLGSSEKRLEIRRTEAAPLIDELIEKTKARLVRGGLLPKSKFKEALGYFCGLIPHLKNYIQESSARLDNNIAERAIRPLAMGRKNWLFVGSPKAGESAAVLLSLVQSCRSTNVNPREYLEDVMRRLMDHNAQKLHELLPVAWANNKSAETSQPG